MAGLGDQLHEAKGSQPREFTPFTPFTARMRPQLKQRVHPHTVHAALQTRMAILKSRMHPYTRAPLSLILIVSPLSLKLIVSPLTLTLGQVSASSTLTLPLPLPLPYPYPYPYP